VNQEQIQAFVMRYLEAEQCDIVEKHPAYVTVKLSPSADKELTFRPYYWSFVERTGAQPETMTCTFIFDPDGHKEAVKDSGAAPAPGLPPQAAPSGAGNVAGGPAGTPGDTRQPDSILGRYFGFVPTQLTARIPKDEVTFGSRRLEQIFNAARGKGQFVNLYEQFKPEQKSTATVPYENWLQVNFKIELACDMKRSEIHSLGIHLGTGEIREHFQTLVLSKRLTPRLPAHIFIIPDKFTLPRAVIYLEEYLERKLRDYDHSWAEEAGLRLADEIDRIRGYYETLIKSTEPDKRAEAEAQYANRRQEINWQYRPRIQISVINCGLFHLQAGSLPSTDELR